MEEQHIVVYKEETHDLLADLEAALLELEDAPDDMELISQIFRSMHTIKGSGAMFGFDDIAAFTHEIEAVLDQVRDGKIRVTKKMIDRILSACDLIRRMVAGENADAEEERALVQAFQEMLPRTVLFTENAPPDVPARAGNAAEMSYRIRFIPNSDIFQNGTSPTILLDEMRGMGECEIVAYRSRIPGLKEMNPESCYFHWDIFLTTTAGINAVRDVFIFVEDLCDLDIQPIRYPDRPGAEKTGERIGDILMARGAISPEVIEDVGRKQKRFGELLLETRAIDRDMLQSALTEQKHIRKAKQRQQFVKSVSSIRVQAEKLDALVDLAGELVTVQARLTRKAHIQRDPELTGIAEEVERLSAELRDQSMNIRMLPVGDTFRRFRRLIHDLSGELGKEVAVETVGEETELDKTVLNQLNDPLMHIIRNALDHGIEMPEVREAKGKPRQGTIRLAAEYSGSDVILRISGDGAGVDFETVRARAIEKGLIPADAEPDERALLDLIFLPGFSTARTVSDVSGRGVGMDVVRRQIENLRGTVSVESRKDVGTAITMRLPLTLAITDGLLVRVGDGTFVIPLLSVEECAELVGKEMDKAGARGVIRFREEIIPYVRLREMFQEHNGNTPEIEKVVIVKVGECRVGFGVDRIIGQYQTVIKSLGNVYRDVENVVGATILGDGSVALILDVNRIVKSLEKQPDFAGRSC
ncbi:chemotaxis protein CheA [Desulfonema ishimotonii]|uniref:Chemotaxis protein CheA n=1 Tax=Desulfonema ishimotonii TaxID=45657 RepID=A0A401FVB5_9BACT|nr:chemotaxis protein CheA [Desulfonema ishimotonii]GBC60901.1 chemotaxis protein CheA [Desulfonema ishimotonii]